jgi:hypothetical protein
MAPRPCFTSSLKWNNVCHIRTLLLVTLNLLSKGVDHSGLVAIESGVGSSLHSTVCGIMRYKLVSGDVDHMSLMVCRFRGGCGEPNQDYEKEDEELMSLNYENGEGSDKSEHTVEDGVNAGQKDEATDSIVSSRSVRAHTDVSTSNGGSLARDAVPKQVLLPRKGAVFRCLFTNRIHSKLQKRWMDGRMRVHPDGPASGVALVSTPLPLTPHPQHTIHSATEVAI